MAHLVSGPQPYIHHYTGLLLRDDPGQPAGWRCGPTQLSTASPSFVSACCDRDATFSVIIKQLEPAVDRHVCAKIDNRERKGARLYNNAYSAADPKPGEPRLRPPSEVDPKSDTWSSMVDGARSFGAGAAMLIRNLATHERGTMTEQECAEALASLSLLARRVDGDRVETA